MEKTLSKYLMFWNKLSNQEKQLILDNSIIKSYLANTILYHNRTECPGLIIMNKGQARVFIHSHSGSELTLYRLIEGDICIMSVSCITNSLDFDIQMQFEKDSVILIIPKHIYQKISNANFAVKDFNTEMISSRLTDIMGIINEVTFYSMKKRLANLLIHHSQLEQSSVLSLTHETLAKDLGTAREVITRILNQLKQENLIELSRGNIRILDFNKLNNI